MQSGARASFSLVPILLLTSHVPGVAAEVMRARPLDLRLESAASVHALESAAGGQQQLEVRGAGGRRIAVVTRAGAAGEAAPRVLSRAGVVPAAEPIALARLRASEGTLPTSSFVLRAADGSTTRVDVFDGEAVEVGPGADDEGPAAPAEAPAEPARSAGFVATQAPAFALLPAMPNPFRRSITLRYRVPTAGHAALELYDAAGRRTATAYAGHCDAGEHVVDFAERGLPKGRYYLRLSFTGSDGSGTRRATQTVVKLD